MSVPAKLFSPRQGAGALMDHEEAKRLAADATPLGQAPRRPAGDPLLPGRAQNARGARGDRRQQHRAGPGRPDPRPRHGRRGPLRGAGKIARLAPELTDEKRGQVGAVVFDILETLARDALPRVRQILSEEPKDAANVPTGVIECLARDDEESVAIPVLGYSPLVGRAFVTAALALKAVLPKPAVQKAVSPESVKGITAIAWKAGLDMAQAMQIQLRLSRIAPAKVPHPRGGDFPLTTDEMEWQLEFFVS